MSEHPILARILRDGFAALGWFVPRAEDSVPGGAKFVIMIGNAGPAMFRRFTRERGASLLSLDEWSKRVVDGLASELDARACYPFDEPALPFLTWARRAGAGHVSPLGLNIHARYGLWHAYRAALLFPVAFDFPRADSGAHPCEACAERPCLSACPVSAFDGMTYAVAACAQHLQQPAGLPCMAGGCLARLACPVGHEFIYEKAQMQFHMQAFLRARTEQ